MSAFCIDQAAIQDEANECDGLADIKTYGPSRPSPDEQLSLDEQASLEEQALLSINRLLTEHAALHIIQWRWSGAAGLVPVDNPPKTPDQLLQKSKLLAEQAVGSGQVQSRIVRECFEGQLQHMVASPLLGLRGSAISVMFPHVSEKESQKSLALRCSHVEVAAAHLSILTIGAEKTKGHGRRLAIEPEIAPEQSREAKQELAAGHEMQSWKQIGVAIWAQCKHVVKSPTRRLKFSGLATAAVVLVALIPFPHRVSCEVICEPATRRFVAAPFDARLLSCQVDVGQSVVQHQVLALLDGSDLRSQIAGVQAKLSQATQRRSAALAQRDASNSEFERLEIQQLQRELEVLENHQMSLEIRSPITGVVVSGDLRRSEGVTFAVGEPLFEVAPLDGMIAEIAIAEEDISYVETGMPSSINLEAIPGKWHRTKIERIHTRSELRDNASVFIAEAAIDNSSAQLRPGMSGSSWVNAGYRPVGWILFHKPYEAIRQLVGW